MITSSNLFNSPKRQVAAKVELYKGSTLANTFLNTDAIKSIKISREGDTNKFFGFGVCQKVEITLMDTARSLDIEKDDKLKVFFSSGGDLVSSFPTFYITEAKRDENNNDIKIVAYDAINAAAAHTVAELGLESGLVSLYASVCALLLGLQLSYDITNTAFSLNGTANYSGSENFRELLDDIAEATQTIYFADSADNLVFKRLDKDGDVALEITKADYFTLSSGDQKTLSKIVSATELGDNIYSGDDSGTTQFIKDNPFWTLREDVATLVESAAAAINGTAITIFDCSWRGNPLLEYGDKISIVAKDDSLVTSFLLSETLEYSGGLKSTIKWDYAEDEAKDSGASVTIGEKLNETYAKVDKVNKQISLVAQQSADAVSKVSEMQITVEGIEGTVSQTETLANGNKEAIGNLKLTTEELTATLSNYETTTDGLGNEVSAIREEISTKLTADEAALIFQKEIANGVDTVTTATGFTFNETGLTVSKTGTEMTTTITEDGMTVYKNDDEVLTANNEGVKAIDLHATTYLIIGENSRFEDYRKDGEARTGCFWIGGN